MKNVLIITVLCISFLFSCKKHVYLETTYSYSSNPDDIRVKIDSFASKDVNNDYHNALKKFYIDSLRNTIIDSTLSFKKDSIISYIITYENGVNLINDIQLDKIKTIDSLAYYEALDAIDRSMRIVERVKAS